MSTYPVLDIKEFAAEILDHDILNVAYVHIKHGGVMLAVFQAA